MHPNTSMPLVDRFLAKINKHSGRWWNGTECWEWTAARNSRGYGFFRQLNPRRLVYAHRFAYALRHGPIPAGLDVCHHCDNPPCVRDEHHFLGTNADNTADMMRKGRHAHGDHVPYSRRARGERNGFAKLTADQVREIRARRAAGETLVSLAATFGVAFSAISKIAKRERWRHIE